MKSLSFITLLYSLFLLYGCQPNNKSSQNKYSLESHLASHNDTDKEEKFKFQINDNELYIINMHGDTIAKNSTIIRLKDENLTCMSEGFESIRSKNGFVTIKQQTCSNDYFINELIVLKYDSSLNNFILNKLIYSYTARRDPNKKIKDKVFTQKDFGNINLGNINLSSLYFDLMTKNSDYSYSAENEEQLDTNSIYYSKVVLVCDQEEFPSVCSTKTKDIYIKFDFDDEPNIIKITKGANDFDIVLDNFFEGLDYYPIIFEHKNSHVLMVNLIYEYNSLYSCYVLERDQLFFLGEISQEALVDEYDVEVYYEYTVSRNKNNLSIIIGNEQNNQSHTLDFNEKIPGLQNKR